MCALTHYHTMPYFDALNRYRCEKHSEKSRNCLEQTVICNLFNLDQSEIFSSGNGSNVQTFILTLWHTILSFNDPERKGLRKNQRKMSKCW